MSIERLKNVPRQRQGRRGFVYVHLAFGRDGVHNLQHSMNTVVVEVVKVGRPESVR